MKPDPERKAPGPSGTGPRAGINEAPNPTTRQPTGQLPQFLRDLLSSPPVAGSGVHPWLFRMARQLHAHRDEQTICDMLAAAVDGCGRHVPEAEIVAAVSSAKECAWQPNSTGRAVTTRPAPKWPTLDQAKRQSVIDTGTGVVDIWTASPIYPTLDSTDTDFFLAELFPGNPLLCIGRDMASFTTAPRQDFRGRLHDKTLIVPSAMNARTGLTKKGKVSAHTLDNTGPRTYLVTEFDSGTADEQAALILHLREFAPLVMVLSSGGKSIHAWWKCHGISESVTLRFFRYAVSLGADDATWTRCQFVRLPQAYRPEKERWQEVYYFNPDNTAKP